MKNINLNPLLSVTVITSSFLAILVIGVPILAPFFVPEYRTPEEIKQWGFLVLGFYFGSLTTLLNETIRQSQSFKKKEKKKPTKTASSNPSAMPD